MFPDIFHTRLCSPPVVREISDSCLPIVADFSGYKREIKQKIRFEIPHRTDTAVFLLYFVTRNGRRAPRNVRRMRRNALESNASRVVSLVNHHHHSFPGRRLQKTRQFFSSLRITTVFSSVTAYTHPFSVVHALVQFIGVAYLSGKLGTLKLSCQFIIIIFFPDATPILLCTNTLDSKWNQRVAIVYQFNNDFFSNYVYFISINLKQILLYTHTHTDIIHIYFLYPLSAL